MIEMAPGAAMDGIEARCEHDDVEVEAGSVRTPEGVSSRIESD